MTAKLKNSTQVMIRVDDKLMPFIAEQVAARRTTQSEFIRACIWAEHDRIKANTTVPETLAEVFES